MSERYVAVSQPNTTFNQPRQKTWIVFQLGDTGWSIRKSTTSFFESQDSVKSYLSTGGMYGNINNIMVAEIVPIDLIITPNV